VFDFATPSSGNPAFYKIVSDPLETAFQVIDEIRGQINDTNRLVVGIPYALVASSFGVDLTIWAPGTGRWTPGELGRSAAWWRRSALKPYIGLIDLGAPPGRRRKHGSGPRS